MGPKLFTHSNLPPQVKSGLQFLKRMGIIEKCGLNGEGDASSDEDTAMALPSRGALAATASASDARDKIQ